MLHNTPSNVNQREPKPISTMVSKVTNLPSVFSVKDFAEVNWSERYSCIRALIIARSDPTAAQPTIRKSRSACVITVALAAEPRQRFQTHRAAVIIAASYTCTSTRIRCSLLILDAPANCSETYLTEGDWSSARPGPVLQGGARLPSSEITAIFSRGLTVSVVTATGVNTCPA